MNYISERRSQTLSNDPYEITRDDIQMMYRENLKDQMECEKVTESSNRGESYYADDNKPGEGKIDNSRLAFYKEVLYGDAKTSGFMMQYPHGVVISQGERNSYYRGENQIYPKSQSSLYRPLEKLSSEKDKQLYRLVADMRIAEFGIFLYSLKIVQSWSQNYGTVLFEPLAQHYGLETEWLDITNDFNVALFFATCYWDNSKKKWFPLTKEQTERSYETMYGVIFHIPQWQASNLNMMEVSTINNVEKCLNNAILPIGFQPFMRCHSQYAYGICMDRAFPLQDDICFEKLHFRHSEQLSNEVYEMMDGGKKIYPQEGLDDFQDVIETIRRSTSFSDEAFQYALEKNLYFSEAAICKNELENNTILGNPIIITGNTHPIKISRQRIRNLNRKYEGFSIEDAYGIQLSTRCIWHPTE